MKRIIFAIILLFPIIVHSQQMYKLEDLVRESLLNNYSIKIGKVSEQIADKNVNIGNAGMLPRIDITRSFQYSLTDIQLQFATGERIGSLDNITTSNNAALQVGLTLFDGLAMFANFDKLKDLREKSKIELKIMIETMTRELALNYFNALKQESNMRILSESLQLNDKRIERIKNRIEYGAALNLELLRAQVDKNTDSSAYLQSELAFTNFLRALNYLSGANIIRQFQPDTVINFASLPSIEALKESMFANNATLMRAVINKEISEKDRKLVLAQFYPRITATAGYNYSRSEADAGFFLVNQSEGLAAGINLQWNLMDGSRHIINAQNSKLMIEIQEINIEMVKANLEMLLNNMYENYSRRLAIYELEQSNIAIAKSNFDRTREEYDLGRATSVELREAQLNLMRSNERINNAKFDAKYAEIELLILTGTFQIAQ
ncbi:MAG: TolC family protein [Desulfobulbaceae bacterium]|nr:TolC family protein [Candidatus Kapabacteria bacterium]MBS4000057.1 TolC family protein [Desulfobulbaceae bacterium]